MASFSDRLKDSEISIKDLRARADEAIAQEKYIEATCIQMCVMEGILRDAIKFRLGGKKELKHYWDESSTHFAVLVDYFELLGGDAEIIKKMREYTASRNPLVHKILLFRTMEDLNQAAQKTFELGESLMDMMIDVLSKEAATIKEKLEKVQEEIALLTA